MESSSRNIKLSGGAVRLNGFSYVSKSEVESKLLCEQLAEGELCRSSLKDVWGGNRKEGKKRRRTNRRGRGNKSEADKRDCKRKPSLHCWGKSAAYLF